jgi:hypothetical protein
MPAEVARIGKQFMKIEITVGQRIQVPQQFHMSFTL